MNGFSTQWRFGSILALVTVVLAGFAGTAVAEVARIREKAVELEQKLNRHQFDVDARGEPSNRARIYKDFDFILEKGKVDEVAEAVGTDPHAERLRLYLIEAIVNHELAPFIDELRQFEQTTTADLGGNALLYPDLLKQLARSADEGERRQLANGMGPLVETGAVFRRDILRRRTDLYRGWGFTDFADFFSQREGIDLDALDAQAAAFLDTSQALYDSLFTTMAAKHLGSEVRKVKFYDLPYLTGFAMYGGALPGDSLLRRTRGVFKGLGLELNAANNLMIDDALRPGKVLDPEIIPALVPTDIRISFNPAGNTRDSYDLACAAGAAQIFTRSKVTEFEPAYLPNPAVQAAFAWLPRLVLDEPNWIRDNIQGDVPIEDYLEYRGFVALYEARLLATLTRFEIFAYRGGEDPDKEFREMARVATGVRVAASDSKRSLEFVNQLKNASRFQGLLLASAARDHLRATFGPAWYTEGKAASILTGLLAQGGNVTPEIFTTAFGNVTAEANSHYHSIQSMLTSAPGGE